MHHPLQASIPVPGHDGTVLGTSWLEQCKGTEQYEVAFTTCTDVQRSCNGLMRTVAVSRNCLQKAVVLSFTVTTLDQPCTLYSLTYNILVCGRCVAHSIVSVPEAASLVLAVTARKEGVQSVSLLHAEPDFLALAERYPDLAPHVRPGQQGRGVIDFKNFEAAR